uniref:SH3 domain-containing protein n=1 Tax=Bursaphelenchus xylophilus TaxID=6326 RepID=A0A1I7SH21_BURXY
MLRFTMTVLSHLYRHITSLKYEFPYVCRFFAPPTAKLIFFQDIRPGRRYKVVTSTEEPRLAPRDTNPQAIQQRVNRMLKEQGVPVLPFVGDRTIKEPIGPTKAYLKHLKNHQNFDTLRSFRSCDNCVLCKQMQEELETFDARKRPPSSTRSGEKSIINGKIFENPYYHEIAELEPQEFADNISSRRSSQNRVKLSVDVPIQPARRPAFERTAKVRRDIRAHLPQQLSAFQGEYVKFQVSQADPNWSFCMNRQGQKGWIPTRELNFATSSTGSSPMST